MPIWMLALIVVIIYIATLTEQLPSDDMLSIVSLMFAIGIVLYEVGERIPI